MHVGPKREVSPLSDESDFRPPSANSDSYDQKADNPVPLQAPHTPLLEHRVIHYSSGNVYEGETLNGQPHGQGTLSSSDGGFYSGQMKFGAINGEGTYHYSEQNETYAQYTGSFVDGDPVGRGVLDYRDGTRYSGEINIHPHGYGKTIFSSGTVYEGEMQNGKFHGQGTLTYTHGVSISGTTREGIFKGPVKVSSNGLPSTGTMIDWQICGNIDSLADLHFGTLIAGLETYGSKLPYTLGVIKDFLKIHRYPEYRQLQQAFDINLSRDSPGTASDIYQRWAKGEPMLLPYGYPGHTMMLSLEKDTDGSSLIKIFNSGDGLKYHPSAIINGKTKYQTVIKYKIPNEQVSEELIARILNRASRTNAKMTYDLISEIPGAELQMPAYKDAIWQSDQKSGNCSIECIFAVLRNQMSLRAYTRMRRLIFEAALNAIETRPPEEHGTKVLLERKNSTQEVNLADARKVICHVLRQKIHKRDNRLAELEPTTNLSVIAKDRLVAPTKNGSTIVARDGNGGTIAVVRSDRGVFLSYFQPGNIPGGLIPLIEVQGRLVLNHRAYAKRPWEPIRTLPGYDDLLNGLSS
ncbi:MAG: hypothetical protein V4534_06855 [Myxococcota bacterium]